MMRTSSEQVTEVIAELARRGLRPTDADRIATALTELRLEQVRALAARDLGAEREVIVASGGRAWLQRTFTTGGIQAVRYVAFDGR